MPKRSMPRLNVTRCGDTASLAVASVCAVRTGWTWCPRPFLGVRNRASGCQAVRAVLASFGTRGSQVQILSPRPTIPAELQTELSQRIRLPRGTAAFGPQVDHDLIAGRVSAGGAPCSDLERTHGPSRPEPGAPGSTKVLRLRTRAGLRNGLGLGRNKSPRRGSPRPSGSWPTSLARWSSSIDVANEG